jgi:hypothetical protein
MNPLATALVVGVVFVLPQAMGLATARAGRRLPAVAWALGATATIAIILAIGLFKQHLEIERARAAGVFVCGTPMANDLFFGSVLLAGHFVLGSILGTLDQRARRD